MGVEVNSRVHLAILDNLSMAENQTPAAEIADNGGIVAHKEDGAPLPRDGAHPPDAFLLKLHIPDSEDLIHNQNLRFQMGGDREGEAHIHPAGIAFDRGVQEFLDVREGDDLVKLSFDLDAHHAKDRAVEENVLPARQFRVKAGADFKQARDLAFEVNAARVGSVMRLKILSSVLLPAPFRPMMPSTSPRLTSNEMFFRARNSCLRLD